MDLMGFTNQTASVGEGTGLDPREAAQILGQSKRQALRQADAQSPLAAYREALRHMPGGPAL